MNIISTDYLLKRKCPFPHLENIGYTELTPFPDRWEDCAFIKYGIEIPEQILRSMKRRRKEFFFGRLCAKDAISQVMPKLLGQIAICNDRRPQFPLGLSGSITHTENFAAAVCILEKEGSIGLDAEPLIANNLVSRLKDWVATSKELELAKSVGMTLSQSLTIIYSVKEALFKALYPQIFKVLDFHDSELVGFNEDLTQVVLRLSPYIDWDFPETQFIGHLILTETIVKTLFIVPPLFQKITIGDIE
ncbi:4'-phosphopantetheinyl transferase family protein [Acinetobacter calcoaceticus]